MQYRREVGQICEAFEYEDNNHTVASNLAEVHSHSLGMLKFMWQEAAQKKIPFVCVWRGGGR